MAKGKGTPAKLSSGTHEPQQRKVRLPRGPRVPRGTEDPPLVELEDELVPVEPEETESG